MRVFELYRKEDVTGVSGTGVVAVGIMFPNGSVAMQWLGARSSIVIHDNMENVVSVHNHNGKTEIRWLNES